MNVTAELELHLRSMELKSLVSRHSINLVLFLKGLPAYMSELLMAQITSAKIPFNSASQSQYSG